MAIIKIIEQIKMSHSGPIVIKDGEEHLIHLQQGSLDGACGPYCLFMGLIICGISNYYELTSLEKISKKTSTGKLLLMLNEYASSMGALIREGTCTKKMYEYLENIKEVNKSKALTAIHKNSNEFKIENKKTNPSKVRDFVIKELMDDHPVVLGITNKNTDHWVLAIGLEFDDEDDFENKKASKILLLDPSMPSPTISAWNGAIDAVGQGKWHIWWGENERVMFDDAISFWVKHVSKSARRDI